MKRRGVTLLIPMLALLSSSLFAQDEHMDYYSPPEKNEPRVFQAQEKLRQGLEVVVQQLDGFSEAWGVDASQIEDVAKLAVQASGWSINNGSPLAITVTAKPLTGTADDFHKFVLEVHAGSTEIQSGVEETPGAIGDISAKRFVDVRKNDPSLLQSNIHEMVVHVATKLRQAITRTSFARNPRW